MSTPITITRNDTVVIVITDWLGERRYQESAIALAYIGIRLAEQDSLIQELAAHPEVFSPEFRSVQGVLP